MAVAHIIAAALGGLAGAALAILLGLSQIWVFLAHALGSIGAALACAALQRLRRDIWAMMRRNDAGR